MISSLRGVIHKGDIPSVTVDVGGVGYEVQCTAGLFETVREGVEAHVHIHTFVREDRLELFGFSSAVERRLFARFLSIPGIGPRTALQLCSVPIGVLVSAVQNGDPRSLSHLKGIGQKMAEKLLVELTALKEKGILVAAPGERGAADAGLDEDALEALANLGYDRRSMVARLREIRGKTTEERVKKVLQGLPAGR